MKVKRIRKFKYRVFKMGIHKFIPAKKFLFFGHLADLSRWINKHDGDVEFSDFPSKKFDYNNREKLFENVFQREVKDEAIDYLEFGVAAGRSFKWWIDKVKNPDSRFYGFDTFTGLPEDWGPFKAGDMSNGDAPPEIDDNRHEFYQGLFQVTLYEFIKTFDSDKKKVIMMDADLYSSTLFVLTTLRPYLKKGDVIFFDEFNVPMHEYKAFAEWTQAFYIEYEVLGQVNNYYQVAMKLK